MENSEQKLEQYKKEVYTKYKLYGVDFTTRTFTSGSTQSDSNEPVQWKIQEKNTSDFVKNSAEILNKITNEYYGGVDPIQDELKKQNTEEFDDEVFK